MDRRTRRAERRRQTADDRLFSQAKSSLNRLGSDRRLTGSSLGVNHLVTLGTLGQVLHHPSILSGFLATSVSGGEGWRQVSELGLALLLSAVIGLEREMRQKSAGLRTHTLVGVGAALFMLISKYGFNDVLEPGRVILDPSRVAAQIVTGVGFLGAGIIFVRRDSVRGLTTAAAIWVTAAVGACAGAGLPILAAVTTVIYLLVALVFPEVTRRLPRSSTAISVLQIRYADGRGILRHLLQQATSLGFAIDQVSTQPVGHGHHGSAHGDGEDSEGGWVEVTMHVHGKGSVNYLAAELSEIDDVEAVLVNDVNALEE
jgi:putative Mg2+ transporter-C (MgtC) family protein